MNAHSLRLVFRRRNFVSLTATFLVLLVGVCGFVGSRAQQSTPEGEREVVEKIPKHLPIKVKVRKPERLKDAKNEDWLGELEVEVTNTGTKPIYYLYISVHLPGVFAPTGYPFSLGLQYGRNKLVALDEPLRPDDVPLLPGEVVVLKLPAEQAELWKRGRARGDRPNPKKVELIFSDLNFGDGTGFIGNMGKPLPEVKERGANATCPGGDGNAVGASSAAHPPRSYFPDVASLATYLPPPASLAPAFLFSKPASPAPAAGQDLCCTSPCSQLKNGTDQGCECPVGERRIARSVSCSDPAGSCGSIIYESLACMVNGQERFCEQSRIDPTCAPHTPTSGPSACTPPDEEPNPCCTPETYTLYPFETQFCRWNCRPDRCATGTVFANGCVSVPNDGATVCEDGYVWTYREGYGALCCPATPTPTPSPTPPVVAGGPPPCYLVEMSTLCPNQEEWCYCMDVGGEWLEERCGCRTWSPVLIDVAGDGFSLTGGAGGVAFDLDSVRRYI